VGWAAVPNGRYHFGTTWGNLAGNEGKVSRDAIAERGSQFPIIPAYRRLASEAFFGPSKRKTVLEDVGRLTSRTEQAQIDDPRTGAVGINSSNREPLYARV
jgi:hypothetical protein